MAKNFQRVEEVLTDEGFLAWYYKEDDQLAGRWQQWLRENPSNQPLVDEAIVFLDNLKHNEHPVDEQHTEQKLFQLQEKLGEDDIQVVGMPTRRRSWIIAAAAVILLVVAGITFWKYNSTGPVLESTYGQVINNQLPDGSTMILNANSTATLSEGWKDGKDREVWLNGEAFFRITKTPSHSRFIVHTANLDVIVTGTQFNVLNRDNKTTVLLTEGSVIIRTADGKELAMLPGDYVEMAGGQALERKEGVEDNVLAWKDNKLAFDNTGLDDVAKIIQHHYGVKVMLADEEVASKSLTGIMPNNNLDGLLEAIEVVLNIKISRTDSTVIFSAKN